jgi:hypothetical protein
MVERYLAGQSLLSLTVWLNESGVAPAVAKSSQTSAVRQILCSGSVLDTDGKTDQCRNALSA